MVPAGVICEIMNEDGTMSRVPDLIEFCGKHDLKMVTVAELIRYRMAHERYVQRVGEAMLPTRYGDFRMVAYESQIDGESHVALIKGELDSQTSRRWSACTRIAWSATSSAPPGAIAMRPSNVHCR